MSERYTPPQAEWVHSVNIPVGDATLEVTYTYRHRQAALCFCA